MKTNDLDIVINVPEQMRANNDYKHCVCQVFSKILYELLFYDLIHLKAINVFAPKTVILYKMPNDQQSNVDIDESDSDDYDYDDYDDYDDYYYYGTTSKKFDSV